jgi:hypothetical protein
MINGRGRQLGRPRCPTILPDLKQAEELRRGHFIQAAFPKLDAKIGVGRLHELLLFRRIK